MRRTATRRPAEGLLLLVLITLALGCGHKEWPRAQAAEDLFVWSAAEASRTGTCATVSGTLRGRQANLDSLAVQIEEMDAEPCLICPFSPQRAEPFSLADPAVTVRGSMVSVLVCGLDPDRSYRVRLVGRNRYMTLGTALSEVLVLPANERS